MELKDWQKFFIEQLDKVPFIPSQVSSDASLEIKAHLSKEAYLNYYCYSGAASSFALLSMLYKPKKIVEAGTGWGIRTALLARLNPEAMIYSIELAKDMGGYPPGLVARHLSNVTLIEGDSREYELSNVELCFIDADHSTESVIADSRRAFTNRNVDNWCIVWDDYPLSTVKDGVDAFVNEVGYPLQDREEKGYVFIGSLNI